MKPKRRQGRPKLPPEQVRRFMMGFTVTAEERRRIRKAAEAEDASISAWVRQWVLDGLRRLNR